MLLLHSCCSCCVEASARSDGASSRTRAPPTSKQSKSKSKQQPAVIQVKPIAVKPAPQ